MAQLVINVENSSSLPDLKKAISMLRGVSKVTVCKSKAHLKTLRAIGEMEKGDTVKCSSFEEAPLFARLLLFKYQRMFFP